MRFGALRSMFRGVALVCALATACAGCEGGGVTGSGGSAGNTANGGSGNSAGTGGTSSDGGGGAGGAGGGPQEGWAIEVGASSLATVEADDGGSVTVACRLLKDGFPYTGVAAPAPTFAPSSGVMQSGSTFSFAEAGTWTFTCETT